jgi:hypothetical protein
MRQWNKLSMAQMAQNKAGQELTSKLGTRCEHVAHNLHARVVCTQNEWLRASPGAGIIAAHTLQACVCTCTNGCLRHHTGCGPVPEQILGPGRQLLA